MAFLVLALLAMKIRESADAPFFIKPITRAIGNKILSTLGKEFEKQFSYIEDQLKTSKGDFICGKELTGADFMMTFSLENSKVLREDKYPLIDAYVESIRARDGYKRAVQKIIDTTGEYSPDVL